MSLLTLSSCISFSPLTTVSSNLRHATTTATTTSMNKKSSHHSSTELVHKKIASFNSNVHLFNCNKSVRFSPLPPKIIWIDSKEWDLKPNTDMKMKLTFEEAMELWEYRSTLRQEHQAITLNERCTCGIHS